MMVTWDDTWRFTVEYKKPVGDVVADIYDVQVIDNATGQTYTVSEGGRVTVKGGDITIKAYIKNVGSARGTVYGQLFVDGQDMGKKSQALDPGVSTTMTWNVTISQGPHSIVIKAGH